MTKFKLIKPDISFKRDLEDFRREMLDANSSMDGSGPLRRMDDIEEWLKFNKACENIESLPEDWVLSDQYVYIREEDSRIVGMIQFRHYFNEFLEKYGGNIGYSIRPSERRKGYAKSMLSDCLKLYKEQAYNQILITCIEGNEASKKTILANGGVYEKTVYCQEDDENLQRYWIRL